MSATVRLQPDTAAVLQACTITDGVLILPPGQLDRKLYEHVNKAIVALGGKWNRKAKGHTFPPHINPAAKLAAALDTGTAVNELKAAGFFETPRDLALHLVDLAGVDEHHVVLEPSAGRGAIADALRDIVPARNLYLIELLEENCEALRAKGHDPMQGDFLSFGSGIPHVDRVVMNPPFERGQDIEHVLWAWEFLRPGGRLVSVMANGITFRTDKAHAAFRALVDEHGYIEPNAEGTFRESGTGVNTVNVVLIKPEV